MPQPLTLLSFLLFSGLLSAQVWGWFEETLYGLHKTLQKLTAQVKSTHHE